MFRRISSKAWKLARFESQSKSPASSMRRTDFRQITARNPSRTYHSGSSTAQEVVVQLLSGWPVKLGCGSLTLLGAATIYQQNFEEDPIASAAEAVVTEEEKLVKPEGQQNAIPFAEVQKHITAEDCWVIINGLVYDVTEFLEIHPGGKQAIIAWAGKDASKLFSIIHPSDALENLPVEACLGPVDLATMPELEEELSEEDLEREEAREEMPTADNFFLLNDFEDWAERVLSKTAWAYYRSAADEERTFHENLDAFRKYFFRPRVLRDMTEGTTETTILGIPTAMPFFISAAAMVKLGHPLGEVNLTRAAGHYGLVQMISSNASCTLEEIFGARTEDQPLMFQLYLNRDRAISADLIRKVDRLGAKAIVFTVDVLWESKRTLDVRTKAESSIKLPANSSSNKNPTKGGSGVSQAIGGYQDRNLTWNDIPFIRQHTKLPIIVKGVQCLEDVQLCVDHGVEGVIISNHGGRQADYAPAPIDVLYEVRTLRPDLFQKIEIMIDGGIRCGADVVKALAMGAKAVGVGRPFLYANGCHGEEGAKRVMEILHEEIMNTMRNIGVSKVEELRPEMIGPAGPWVGPFSPNFRARQADETR